MKRYFLIYIILLLSFNVFSQNIITINWKKNTNISDLKGEKHTALNFQNAAHSHENNYLPIYHNHFLVNNINAQIHISDIIIQTIKDSELKDIELSAVENDFVISSFTGIQSKQASLHLALTPIRYNTKTKSYEKIISFSYKIIYSETAQKQSQPPRTGLYNSPLSAGEWYKFFVKESGFYKISYTELQSLGLDINNINPKTIKIYGYGGGMLPELAGQYRHNDMHEIPIEIIGEDDGVFNNTDYIIIYAGGPDQWVYMPRQDMFFFEKNYYSRKAGYYITHGGRNGKRLNYRTTIPEVADTILDNHICCKAIEETDYSIIHSGRRWYSNPFTGTKTFQFNFKDINKNKKAKFSFLALGRQFNPTRMYLDVEDIATSYPMGICGTNIGTRWGITFDYIGEFNPTTNNISVKVKYNKSGSESMAVLGYIYINALCYNNYNTDVLKLRHNYRRLAENYNVVQHKINTNSNNLYIFDVTDRAEPMLVEYKKEENSISFKSYTDKAYTFVCFDYSNFKTVELGSKIERQNIHGDNPPQYIIVYHEKHKTQAEKLRDFHTNNSGFIVGMYEINEVYNEFSSGVQDATAIRDMMKYFYDNATETQRPKYLLLLGGTSYDPLNRANTNYYDLPIYQSKESNGRDASFCTDDFFCCLDDNEGDMSQKNNLLDAAVGRIIGYEPKDLEKIVDKIIHYQETKNFDAWCTNITLVADDYDKVGEGHLSDLEGMAATIDLYAKPFNIKKIYSSAYEQITTSGGQKYPGVTKDINADIEQGTLLWVYAGHSGPKQISHEELLAAGDVNSWRNIDKLPFFVTLSCSLTPIDEPSIFSLGEQILHNPKGGAVAMFTSQRVSYGSHNRRLVKTLAEGLFNDTIFNTTPSIGDSYVYTKNSHAATIMNTRSYALLGDPAMVLNYPKIRNSIEIDKLLIDGEETNIMKSLSTVNIKGHVKNGNGSIAENFNGILFAKINDKPRQNTTLGNDLDPIQNFYTDNSIIYKGKVNIENGRFKINFIVPKDIRYNFGEARMRFYFYNETIDGDGYFDDYVVGGTSDNYIEDFDGPEIKLFIDNENFISGNETNENPLLIAKLKDKSGINTTGSSIGHDIIAYIDDDISKHYSLNDYYEADLNSFQSGSLNYNLYKMASGKHTLTLRAWDVFNNSSSADIDFVVIGADEIIISDLINYPNPFSDKTTFQISSNQNGEKLEATLYIMDYSGRLVKTLHSSYYASGTNDDVFSWDGKNDNGTKVKNGLYYYRLILVKKDGSTNISSGKLIKTNNKM